MWCSQNLTGNDSPKLLECLHIACSTCVAAKFAELDRNMQMVIHCPVCNMGSQHDGIIDNQFLIEQSLGSDDNQGNSDSDTKVFNFFFFRLFDKIVIKFCVIRMDFLNYNFFSVIFTCVNETNCLETLMQL